MKPYTLKILTFTFCSIAFAAYGGSTQDARETAKVVPGAETAIPLVLDFTLELAATGIVRDTLTGSSLHFERGDFVISDASGHMVYLSPEGKVNGQRKLQLDSPITGLEYIGDSQYLISSEDNRLWRFNESTNKTTELARLPFAIDAVAYDPVKATAIVIDTRVPAQLVSIDAQGGISATPLNISIEQEKVTGLHLVDGQVFAAIRPERKNSFPAKVISLDMKGQAVSFWSLEAEQMSSLLVINAGTSEFLATNGDQQQSVTLYEPLLPASNVAGSVPELLAAPSLGFDQPSGVDYLASDGSLYYISDFGEVRQGNEDGSNQLLFTIDSMQGSYEAISYMEETKSMALMRSDEASQSSNIDYFDLEGNLLSTYEIPLQNPLHVFESLDYAKQIRTLFAVTSTKGTKSLYRINNGDTRVIPLPARYDDFVITGLSVTDDGSELFFITEEWESDKDQRNAGWLVHLDVETQTELSRVSIATSIEGKLQGVRDPSGIAYDKKRGVVFITSDVDQSSLLAFDSD